jgi:murein DD-endopeptidase MepM/ murein hydrolase activator NlpD
MRPPIKNYRHALYPKGDVTQWFGVNQKLYNTVCPVTNADGSKMCLAGHNGIDIVAPHGEPIYAVEEGFVTEVNNSPTGYGKHVRITKFNDDGTGEEWVYGHLSVIRVVNGQRILTGDRLGDMGNTGFVVSGATPYWTYNPYAGTHLHLGKRNITHKGQGNVTVLNYLNGYFGSVDFQEELRLGTIEDIKKTLSQLQLTFASLYNAWRNKA